MTPPVASPASSPPARAGFTRTSVEQPGSRAAVREDAGAAPPRDPIPAETTMEFSYDRVTRRIVIRVVSRETGEVVRQIPPEEYLAFVARFRELVGAIFDRQM